MENMGKNINFSVNTEKCIKCGMCANDCPMSLIKMDDFPKIRNPDYCIECHHCFAVCPVGAISICSLDADKQQITETKINSDDFINLVKNRRSIRRYKSNLLEQETLDKLCEALAYAPTAKNVRNLKFTILNSKEKLEEIRELTYKKLENGPTKAHGFNFQSMGAAYRRLKFDRLFLNAPHMIVVSAPSGYSYAPQDTMIALSYFELFANSQGIGTLWDGIVTMLYREIMPEMKQELGIPDDYEIQYVMLFGKPAVKYKRAVDRKLKDLNFL